MKALGWPAATIIGITVVTVELLPVVLGTGDNAIYDWSLAYVTLRFIVLPLVCLAHIGINLWLLVRSRDRRLSERLVTFSSVVIPCAFLVFSYLHPLFMFNAFLE